LAARIIGYSHLIKWKIEYSPFYAELCIAFHFRDNSSVDLGTFDLETSPQDPSRCLELYHNPWWTIHIDKPFGDNQWTRALAVYRTQAQTVLNWKDSDFHAQLERIILTLDRCATWLFLGEEVDIWSLEETECRLEELEDCLAASRDTAVDVHCGRRAQAMVFVLASRARAALSVRVKTREWSRSMEEEIVRH